jgi:hypothetical protein
LPACKHTDAQHKHNTWRHTAAFAAGVTASARTCAIPTPSPGPLAVHTLWRELNACSNQPVSPHCGAAAATAEDPVCWVHWRCFAGLGANLAAQAFIACRHTATAGRECNMQQQNCQE